MASNIIQVLNKIHDEKEVNLSKSELLKLSADDLIKKMKSKMGKSLDDYESTKIAHEKSKKSVTSKWKSMEGAIVKEWNKMSKMARELGVAENDIPNFKKMTSLYFFIDAEVKKIK